MKKDVVIPLIIPRVGSRRLLGRRPTGALPHMGRVIGDPPPKTLRYREPDQPGDCNSPVRHTESSVALNRSRHGEYTTGVAIRLDMLPAQ